MDHTTEEIHDLYNGIRGLATKILTRIERTDAYLDKLLDSEMNNSDLNPMDKRLLNELVHGVLRNQTKLDWVLTGFYHGQFNKVVPNVRNALRIALYQLLFLTRIPHHASVNEAVEFIKKYRGQRLADTMNGLLRNIARNVENIRYPLPENDELQYLSVVYSHPPWIVRRWRERFDFATTEALLKANNIRPFLTLRFNSLKTNFEQLVEELGQLGVDYRQCHFMTDYLTVRNLPNLRQTKLFNEGFFTIQDESAGLVGKLLAPQPGETVIDLCSAPGGKAIHAAEMMKNTGRVIAVDRYGMRLNFVKKSADRCGITIIETIEGNAAELELPQADKVIADVPCSGLGVLSKKPDIKWKREAEDIGKLTAIQRSILENAARMVRPGGVLVYSTCTIEPDENCDIIREFLSRHDEFAIDPAQTYLPHQVVSSAGFLETLPHRHRMDGAFAARLVKKPE